MVTIKKRRQANGFFYEIDDFAGYVNALEQRGIDAPRARFRIFIPSKDDSAAENLIGKWEDEVKLFFKLSPATEIECQIIE